ncbi:hypothetical protein ABH944_002987 [Caballeronia udeis]|uniref:Uncharacterized protein n=1 Tax=Caballeronia udeis TaxID=1232866 RepID=A0ABW8MGQ9_9BURK
MKPDPAQQKQVAAAPDKQVDMVVDARDGKSDERTMADLAGTATFRAAVTARQIIGSSMAGLEPNVGDFTASLSERFDKTVIDGDMSKVEAMLLAQAHTCELIFHEFARRALRSETLPRLEAYMRLALKSQQQSASTLRVLGEVRNPRQVAFIKQQNNAAGHQQVNNGVAPTVACAHGENPGTPNELLEHQHGEWLDAGAASEASRGNQEMAAVGTIDGAEVGTRESDVVGKRDKARAAVGRMARRSKTLERPAPLVQGATEAGLGREGAE